jgi:hypothetical protein
MEVMRVRTLRAAPAANIAASIAPSAPLLTPVGVLGSAVLVLMSEYV